MSAVLEAVKPPIEKRAVVLTPSRMALAEQWRQDWIINAEEGTTIEDVLDTGYLAHKAVELQRFDHIEVREETGRWIAELIVLDTGRNWARTYLVAKYDLESNDSPPASAVKYEVMWRGAQHKWCVKRLSDSNIVQGGMVDKATAQAWLANHELVVNA